MEGSEVNSEVRSDARRFETWGPPRSERSPASAKFDSPDRTRSARLAVQKPGRALQQIRTTSRGCGSELPVQRKPPHSDQEFEQLL
jgi:hypothetical protein